MDINGYFGIALAKIRSKTLKKHCYNIELKKNLTLVSNMSKSLLNFRRKIDIENDSFYILT